MRRLFAGLALILILVFQAAPAFAGQYNKPVGLSNMRAVMYPGGSVELTWLVRSVPALTDSPDNKIILTRQFEGGPSETVATLDCPPPGNTQSWYQMTYTDTPPRVGEAGGNYTYAVVCYPYNASCTINTQNITADENGNGGANPTEGGQPTGPDYEIFTTARWAVAMTWYYTLAGLSGVFMFWGMLRSGYRYLHASVNPGMKADFWMDVQRCLLAVGIIAFTPLLVSLLIDVNNGFVTLFANILNTLADQARFASPDQTMDGAGMFEKIVAAPFKVIVDIFNKIFGLNPLDQLIFNGHVNILGGSVFTGNFNTGNALADVLLNICMVGFDFYYNALYTIRRWTVIATLVSTPLIVWVWVLTEERQVLEIWAGEIVATIFMQTFHALSFGVFLSILCASNFGIAKVLTGVGIQDAAAGLHNIGVWVGTFGGTVCTVALVIIAYRMICGGNEKQRVQTRESFAKAVTGVGIIGLSLTIAGFLVYLLGDPVNQIIAATSGPANNFAQGAPGDKVTLWDTFFMIICVIPISRMFSTIFMKLVVRAGVVNEEGLAAKGSAALGGLAGMIALGRTTGMALVGRTMMVRGLVGSRARGVNLTPGGGSPPTGGTSTGSFITGGFSPGGNTGGSGGPGPAAGPAPSIQTGTQNSSIGAPISSVFRQGFATGGGTAAGSNTGAGGGIITGGYGVSATAGAPGGIASGISSSAGGSGPAVPGGYTTLQSGLIVPASAAPASSSSPLLSGQNAMPLSLDEVVSMSGKQSDKAAMAGAVTGAAGSIGAPEVAPALGAMIGGTAKAVANPLLTTYHIGRQLARHVKAEGGFSQGLKAFTGAKTTGEAAASVAGAIALSPLGSRAASFGASTAARAVNATQKAVNYGVDNMMNWKKRNP
ncbi:MAG TPA: hypothetical protein GXX25_13275 [Desulfotomaculum sp.]|nr:hypothetical protein [Desulfotomaculum sp.]